MYRILIVEDDQVLAQAMAKHISGWGWEARTATDFRDVRGEFVRFEPHLVLLDVGLPFYNGFHWCQEIRRLSQVPVIFVSAAGDNMNIIMAMNMGGDDFIVKPFDLTVLAAKIQAWLRRSYAMAGTLPMLDWDGASLNLSTGVLALGEERVELSRNEHKILQLLLENRGQVVSRDDLMLRLWQSDSFVDENTLAVNVARLRRRLDELGRGDLIRTAKGEGYWVE